MGFANASLAVDFSLRKGTWEDSPSILHTGIFAASKDSREPPGSLP